MSTPTLHTRRRILRSFAMGDIPALHCIYSNRQANTFLPWFPITGMDQAEQVYRRYPAAYARGTGQYYAVCPAQHNTPKSICM